MKLPRFLPTYLFSLLGFSVLFAAPVKLPRIFADHMVLQRDTTIPVWGTADPGATVTVSFADQKQTAQADGSGKWVIRLQPLPASEESRELTVQAATSSIKYSDVLVGDVWLASGQSNMGSPVSSLKEVAEITAKAADPLFRFFSAVKTTASEPQADVAGKWEVSNSTSIKGLSAVAYYFAKELRETQKVPVAIVHSSWGGTPIQTWISLAALQQNPPLTRQLDLWKKAVEDFEKVQANPQLVEDYKRDLDLYKKEVEPAFAEAKKAYEAAKAAGQPVGPKPTPLRPEPSNPDPMGMPSPSRRPSTPAVAFNGSIAPLAPYGIRGVIWYQGEADGSNGYEYRSLFPRLIADWRKWWQNETLPFLFVQIPAGGVDTAPVAQAGMPYLREAQFLTLQVPYTGMASGIDVGDPTNAHPADKSNIGHRLALLARNLVYGEKIVSSGPLYDRFIVDGNAIKIHFRETGGGLTIAQAPWHAASVEPWPTDKLIGFYIAGADKKWVEAEAKIVGDTVIVSSRLVAQPAAVRYAWASSPRANLYNKEGLPASPFRTDDWGKPPAPSAPVKTE